ncbi:hypothetical protein EE612_031159, partial [Oryza sativa]
MAMVARRFLVAAAAVCLALAAVPAAMGQAAAPAPKGAAAAALNVTAILEKGGSYTTFIRLMKSTQQDTQLNSQLNGTSTGFTVFAPHRRRVQQPQARHAQLPCRRRTRCRWCRRTSSPKVLLHGRLRHGEQPGAHPGVRRRRSLHAQHHRHLHQPGQRLHRRRRHHARHRAARRPAARRLLRRQGAPPVRAVRPQAAAVPAAGAQQEAGQGGHQRVRGGARWLRRPPCRRRPRRRQGRRVGRGCLAGRRLPLV